MNVIIKNVQADWHAGDSAYVVSNTVSEGMRWHWIKIGEKVLITRNEAASKFPGTFTVERPGGEQSVLRCHISPIPHYELDAE